MAIAKTTGRRPRFDSNTLRFLAELAAHNERPWFAANKQRYDDHVVTPALAFIETLAEPLGKISRHFVAAPKRVGGSLMRVYRDTRFARDKTPFKTNIGIQFRHERGKDVHAPGFYVHIEPGASFLGAGIWHPEPSALTAIRMAILEQPDAWRRTRDRAEFRSHFELSGEQLARLPRGFPAEAPHADDLRRKDFIATCTLADRDVLRADFAGRVVDRFRSAAPLMRFLCGALDFRY
jgi:uncharacterized protein (TIGR02453 family)